MPQKPIYVPIYGDLWTLYTDESGFIIKAQVSWDNKSSAPEDVPPNEVPHYVIEAAVEKMIKSNERD